MLFRKSVFNVSELPPQDKGSLMMWLMTMPDKTLFRSFSAGELTRSEVKDVIEYLKGIQSRNAGDTTDSAKQTLQTCDSIISILSDFLK